MADRPTTLLVELTHRCPLHCPYCSNPLELVRSERELATEDWTRVLSEARALGVLQLGLSGGEPLVRRDLEAIVSHAHGLGLYTTLVTSAVGLTEARTMALRDAGLEHIQISFQDAGADGNDRIAGTASWEAKMRAAEWARTSGMAFTVNVVLHRENLDHLEEIIAMAARLGADRLELANTQYYGWALENRDALLPTREQLARAEQVVDRAVREHRGRMRIVYVLPDYFAEFPKPCQGGWGSVYIVIAPDGTALPCHAASQITSLAFDSVRERSLDWIWRESPAFTAFRGETWMREPCASCPRRAQDFGGCRCQAFALTGDARRTDPVCSLSPDRALVDAAIARALAPPRAYRYREMSRAARAI